MRRQDFQFDLPPELIAQQPPARRGDARLLAFGGGDAPRDHRFADLPALLRAGDLLVLNDTQVLRARLRGVKRDSGGRVELLVERVLDERRARCQLRASKSPRPGTWLRFDGGAQAEVQGREGDFFVLRFDSPVLEVLAAQGEMPLPPYIERAAGPADEERYQTVFAARPGAVAAPTAGLHFERAMLDRLAAQGVAQARLTLHVGAGTYQPVRAEALADHRMHAEWLSVGADCCAAVADCRARGGRVVAVGTTVVRALESAARAGGGALAPFSGESRLFLHPGEPFYVIDRLITNFHLSESTLLMLVSAFAGREATRAAYAHAIAQRYRFFSYGDACFISPAPGRQPLAER